MTVCRASMFQLWTSGTLHRSIILIYLHMLGILVC